jgi:alginate O-acetyltransferase complex protein AlgI
MLFVEFRFFFFFAFVFTVYWALRQNTPRKIFLLAASYFFYACWDWRFLFLLIGSTTLDYTIGRLLGHFTDRRKRQGLVAISLCVNLGLLGFFKYCNFFIGSASALLGWLGLPASLHTLQIILPVGLSFYTFQSMSYTLEIYRGHLQPVRKPLDLAFFVAFFPQLVAGPIVRATTFLPQVHEARRLANVAFRPALTLFLIGFIKKACIAENAAPYVEQFFAAPHSFTVLSAWIAVLLYAVQIYCDFSGYTDMAIACARLLGYELTINFNFPYFADSLTDFWRRWHISLSTWLRDYLYISLGGNRGGKWFTYRNLMLTMLLGGLWHGGAWTFVVWGGLHGLALIIHKEWTGVREKIPGAMAVMKWLAVPLTFYWVCIAWIFFRAVSFQDALDIVQRFVLLHAYGKHLQSLDPRLLLFFAGVALIHYLNFRGLFSQWWRRPPAPVFAAGYGSAAALALLFVPMKYTPFIYFQF